MANSWTKGDNVKLLGKVSPPQIHTLCCEFSVHWDFLGYFQKVPFLGKRLLSFVFSRILLGFKRIDESRGENTVEIVSRGNCLAFWKLEE